MFTAEAQRTQREHVFSFLLRGQKGKDLPLGNFSACRITMEINELSSKIIGAAIEVHKALGPGLLESAYEESLSYELGLRGLSVERQKPHLLLIKQKNWIVFIDSI